MVGLTSAEAARALDDVGPNALPVTAPPRLLLRVARSAKDPLVLVLLGAAVLTLVTRDLADAAVIGLVLVVNTVVSVRQELGADRALEALSNLGAPECRVVRDGTERVVLVRDVVPGDLVLLGEGDLVPADGSLLDAVSLRVDESTLTGESVPIDKVATGDPAGEADSSRLLAGTAVVHGRGTLRVDATGRSSTLGQIAAMLQGPRVITPLQRRMGRLSGLIAAATIVLCAVVLVIGWARGQDLELMVLAAVSLAVAAVPESLPAVVTISLSLAARRMARRHALVRNLAAVETLGSVTLLATDKTGTLTNASMSVVDWWPAPGVDPWHLRRAAALCNDATLDVGRDGGHAGDPTEVALLVAARDDAHLGTDDLSRFPRVAEVPFDSVRKRMTTAHTTPDGDLLVVCKGAPESLATADLLDDGTALREALQRSHSLSASGLRVLALAERREPQAGRSAERVADDLRAGGSPLRLLGLVALQDPPRASAHATLDSCRTAGIRVVLVTGDHALTATSIARQVGLAPEPLRQLDLSQQPLDNGDGLDVDVIARATPADKLAAIRIWQDQGHVVAMTGDGVNDGPALRRADIGVAMGQRGTEVARQAADLVIADDELATVVAAVEEGRRVYANIRRFLLYGLSGGMAEIVVMLVGPFVGMPLPLLPAQILWINLLTHSLTGTALGSEPVEVGSMTRPPRSPREGVLGGGLWWRIAVLMLVVAGAGGVAAWAVPSSVAQSTLMVALGTAMLGVALGVRARGHHPRANPLLPVSVTASELLLVAAVEVPPLQELMGTTSIGWAGYAASVAAGLAAWLLTRLLRVS
ncbi:MAG TPA: cation-transporting P-type ATPase [Angustibacter sp.]|nr:cation-transporting P-type ATPase [Angustibacter sp.]